MKISNLEKVNEIQNKIKELHNLKIVLINKPTCFATQTLGYKLEEFIYKIDPYFLEKIVKIIWDRIIQYENELKKLGVDVYE